MKKILFTIVLLPLLSFGQIISQYVETNSGTQPKGIEIYNNTGNTLTFDATTPLEFYYASATGNNAGAAYSTPYILNSATINDTTLAPGEVLVIGSSNMASYVTTNNSECYFKSYGWSFNGDDQITVKHGGVITDTFGLTTDPGYNISHSTVSSANDNIQLLPGILIGDTDYWEAKSVISDRFEKVADNPYGSGTYILTGFGIPPTNFIYNSSWNSWDSSNEQIVNTSPSFTGNESILIASGSISIGSSTSVSSTFRNVQVNSGATLTIDPGADLIINTASTTPTIGNSKTWGGDFINNGGTVVMNSDATNFSSLIINGDATGNITYNRWVNSVSNSSPSDANPGWDLVGSPVLNGTLDPTTLATSGPNYGILPFDNSSSSNGAWTNTTSNATFTTSTGVGYAMAKSSAGTVAFTGVPNTFTHTSIAITNNTTSSGTHWNLVANPFPAFLALNGNANTNDTTATAAFLWYNAENIDVLGHSDFDEGIWYWDGTDYITKNNSSPGNLYAVPGQAFFISAQNASDNVAFRTGMITTQASSGSGDDFIEGDQLEDDEGEIHISALQNQIGNSAEIYFNEFGSDGLNEGYDTRSFPSAVNRIYSRLVENDTGVNLAIQTLAYSEMWDKVIPLGINALGGEEMTIGISHRTTPADLNIYLEDTEEGTMTNLLEGDFVYTPASDLSGVGRFFIHMSADTMSNEEVSTSMLNAYKEIDASYITIEGLATQTNETNVSLYNILGRKVLSTTLNNNMGTQTISTVGLSAGIYVIELESGSDRLTKKLLIQ